MRNCLQAFCFYYAVAELQYAHSDRSEPCTVCSPLLYRVTSCPSCNNFMLSLFLVFSVFVFVLKAYLPVCVCVCLIHPSETLSEILSHVSFLEEELSVKDNMLKATQGELLQCKKELTTKELNLQKTHTRIAQESERVKTHTTIATDIPAALTTPTNKMFSYQS